MKKISKLFKYIRPYWSYVLLNFLFNGLSVLFSLFSLVMVIPFLRILFERQPAVTSLPQFELNAKVIANFFYYHLGEIINDHGKLAALGAVSVLVIIMMFLKTLFRYLGMFYLAPLRTGIIEDLRNDLYLKSLTLPLSFYSKERKGDLMSRMTTDVAEVEWSILSSVEMIFRSPITILIYLIALMVMSPGLTMAIILVVPLTGYVIGRIGRILKKSSKIAQSRLGYLISVIEETIGGLRIIKSFNAENLVGDQFVSYNRRYTSLMTKIFRRRYLASPLTEFIGTAVVMGAMWYGGFLILKGADNAMIPEVLISYVLVFSQIIPPSKSFSQASYNIQKGLASVERINMILNSENPIKDIANPKSLTKFSESIVFENVSFKYDKAEVIHKVDIEVEKGQTVALVGHSGSGKSTLADLLPRFYDVDTGAIKIDGNDIREIAIKDLRSLMGIVSQETILFNDTIFNNISFGAADISEDDVIQAAKIANAHEFIDETENKYKSNIGDRGVKLSGGQRQRLSIARAILQNPSILILDEATSALDTESEKLVQQALTRLMENRTSLVIAHRLSTIKNADRIYVLENGKVVESGKHQELMNKGGAYSELYNLQNS